MQRWHLQQHTQKTAEALEQALLQLWQAREVQALDGGAGARLACRFR